MMTCVLSCSTHEEEDGTACKWRGTTEMHDREGVRQVVLRYDDETRHRPVERMLYGTMTETTPGCKQMSYSTNKRCLG